MNTHYFLRFCPLLLLIFLKATEQKALDPKQTLHDYGYLNTTDPDEETMTEAVKMFQQYFELAVTGSLDENTMEQMSRPRCGMPDNAPPQLAQSAYKWRKNAITYKIRNTTEVLTKAQVRSVVEDSIKLWLRGVDLKISESQTDYADIDIYFNYQDGRNNVLGYAYYPENGDIYFDTADEWSLTRAGARSKIFAGWLVAHEMGHALGLSHAGAKSSIMYPYYISETEGPSSMDINNLKHLYGGATVLDNNPFCQRTSVDDVMLTTTNDLLLLKGKQFWRISDGSVKSGPFSLDTLFPGIPNNVDAAFSIRSFNYFLKGNILYRFRTGQRIHKRKLMSVGFENLPSNVDAAFFEPNDDVIYFFRGAKYYEFDTKKPIGRRLDLNGKRIADNWVGLPNDVEAATYLGNNRALFIKNSKCYTVDSRNKKLLENEDCTTSLFNC